MNPDESQSRPLTDYAAPSDDWPVRYSFVIHGGREGAWTLDAVDFREVRARLGDELICHFARCFTIANHLTSAFDLVGMNYQMAAEDSARQARNLLTLILIVTGYVRELSGVLGDLRSAGIETSLSPPAKERWAALARFERLAQRRTIKLIRDELAFHPGSPAMMRDGIEALVRQNAVVRLMVGDGPLDSEINVTFGHQLAEAGLDIKPEVYLAAFSEVRNVHLSTIAFIKEIFVDLLRSKNLVNAEPLMPLSADVRARLEADGVPCALETPE